MEENQKNDPAGEGRENKEEKAEGIKNNILLVEDDNDLRSLYTSVLKDAGYVVEQADEGELGFELIKSTEWNLLLLDIMLPGKDGMSILKTISNEPELKKGPIVLFTSLNSEEVVRDAYALGADGYLIKTELTPDKLVNEVNHFLGNE